MFTKISHASGVMDETEILFSTPFDYLYPDAARSPACLLPAGQSTIDGLKALGLAMADTGTSANPGNSDSNIDAIFTYLGQFIDHDITARTDRDSGVTNISVETNITPVNPDTVITQLRNGRRPQLDLDSVFGEGPAMVNSASAPVSSESQILYDANFKFNVFQAAGRLDLPRQQNAGVFQATIADMRNDENLNVSQLHMNFLRFYNHVYDAQNGTPREKYIRARQLVRWAYQFVVVHDYLMNVCDRNVVMETLANGPRYYSGRSEIFMPLEFSTAAFRFGHSMIRPFYKLNDTLTSVKLVDTTGGVQILAPNSRAQNFETDNQLKADMMIQWKNYLGASAQKARLIDTKIAHDLFTLPFRNMPPILSNLAISNLVRAYNLSIPTGQAVCDVMGINPLTPAQILTGEDPAIAAAIQTYNFQQRSPLWYYILREAAVQQGGQKLGEVGSRIVSETLIGLLKQDPNSYLNNLHDTAVTDSYIKVTGGATGQIKDLKSLLTFAGVTGL